MKKGKIIIGIVSAALVIGMFVLTFFVGTVAEYYGYSMEMKNIVWGSKELVMANDPVSAKDAFGVETTGINLLPAIGGIVAVASAVAYAVVCFVAKSDKIRAILGTIFAILIVAGSIMQFYALALLPEAITREALAEGAITEDLKDQYLEVMRQMFTAYSFKPDTLGILSGALGCVGGVGVVVSAMLPSKK